MWNSELLREQERGEITAVKLNNDKMSNCHKGTSQTVTPENLVESS